MEKMKMHSKNITQEQIEKLMELFPNCVTESVAGAIHELPLRKTIDWDLLKQELSDHIVEGP